MSRHSISTVPTANENPQKHSSKDLSEKNTKKIHRRTFPDLVTALKGVLNLNKTVDYDKTVTQLPGMIILTFCPLHTDFNTSNNLSCNT